MGDISIKRNNFNSKHYNIHVLNNGPISVISIYLPHAINIGVVIPLISLMGHAPLASVSEQDICAVTILKVYLMWSDKTSQKGLSL